jgi:hypothetical protein
MVKPSRRILLALAACALALAAGSAPAQRAEAQAPEASVKAAFLYKFLPYVEWPPASFPSADAPFVIAVTGSDEVASELARILPGRAVEGHPVVLRRLKEGEGLKGVHMLFVGKAESARLPQHVRAAQQAGVLVVSESERGLESGSAVNFVTSEERVGFEVAVDAAERTGHRISSRMLMVARRVAGRPQ